ncbi:MAG: prolipoprotein diacylglyceryl transferase [Nocardiopsaceae bacterium]|jgi:prolipoprotein diacylglyceryl transferase|nr:prolipoprotein diacylglyceryl transferase [Nocardiopsaceae bacterium]
MTPVAHTLAYIPSPPINGFHIGPLFVHFYGLMYVIGITLAILITQRRIRSSGGDPSVVGDIALWAVPAGIIGGRIYFDITTPADIPHVWYGPFAVWTGGLGIWGGIAAGALVGVWRVKRRGLAVAPFADAVAPALLVAQAVGRIGNYFNQELFGRPTTLPWALFIDPGYRPHGYRSFHTFQPTFLYELIFDLALAAFLVWLGHHTKVKPPGLFALYVAGYSAFRIFEESLRIDSSEHFLGLRLNMYVAAALTLAGIIWFIMIQRRPARAVATGPKPDDASGADVGDAESSAGDEGQTPPSAVAAETKAGADDATTAEGTEGESAGSGSVPDKTGRRA